MKALCAFVFASLLIFLFSAQVSFCSQPTDSSQFTANVMIANDSLMNPGSAINCKISYNAVLQAIRFDYPRTREPFTNSTIVEIYDYSKARKTNRNKFSNFSYTPNYRGLNIKFVLYALPSTRQHLFQDTIKRTQILRRATLGQRFTMTSALFALLTRRVTLLPPETFSTCG